MKPDRVYFTRSADWVFIQTAENTTYLKVDGREFQTCLPGHWAYSYSISTQELREALQLIAALGLAKREIA